MAERASRIVVALVAVAFAAACTQDTSGVATPGADGVETTTDASGGESSPPSSGGGADPTVDIPSRPRDLSLDGVDPCSLFTPAQLAEVNSKLKFDEPPEAGTSNDEYDAAMCTLAQSAEPFNAIDILAVTTVGIEHWLSGQGNVDAWLVSVDGYPAADYKLMGTEDEECVTSVGVADGQQLMVDLQAVQETDYRELCEITEQVATMAVQTLQTLG